MAIEFEAPRPQSRLKVTLTILFHSSCAIWSTLVSKSALNSIESPILLLTLQFSVQVLLLTAIGVPLGWIQPIKPPSVGLHLGRHFHCTQGTDKTRYGDQ